MTDVQPFAVTHIDNRPDGVHRTLTDDSTLSADLLVGADGIHSAVRALVFGDEQQYLRYLGFHTAAYVFADAEIHAQVQSQFCLTDTIDRQMGLGAAPGGLSRRGVGTHRSSR